MGFVHTTGEGWEGRKDRYHPQVRRPAVRTTLTKTPSGMTGKEHIMHIEPHIVEGAKIALSLGTAAGVTCYGAKIVWQSLRENLLTLAGRAFVATALVFCFFQVLPHYPVGVSEVHFILGSTLFLVLGAAPAAIGLALGLLLQGVFFAPLDLPQYGMNITTLLVPLFALRFVAARIIAPKTAYVDVSYAQALALSVSYQGGIVAWVAFWAFYGQGFGAANIQSVALFGSAYMLVVLIEPLVDLAVLGLAKTVKGRGIAAFLPARLYQAA